MIDEVGDKVHGIDINEEGIEKLGEEGYHVEVQNAEDFYFDKQFDVIVAGELIEHLENQGLFLDRANEHLKEGGKLVVTTPNATSLVKSFHRLKSQLSERERVGANSHLALHNEETLRRLLQRKGFDVEKIQLCSLPRNWIEDKIAGLISLFGGGSTLIVVAQKVL